MATRDLIGVWSVLAALAAGTACRGQPIQRLGTAGDSLTAEYYEINLGYAEAWTQILVRTRQVDMGPTAAQAGLTEWTPLRGWGFEFNFARAGATTDNMVLEGEHSGLADAVLHNGVSHVVICPSGNDFAHWNNGVYQSLYNGTWTEARRNAYCEASVDNVRLMVQTVRAAGARVVLCTMPDFSVTPFVQNLFPDAAGRASVRAAVLRVNGGLRGVAEQNHVPLVDLFSLNETIFGMPGSERGTLMVGGVPIRLVQASADNPTTAFVGDGLHLGTVMQAIWCDAIIAGLNAGYGAGIPELSEQEMLALIDRPIATPGTLAQRIGPFSSYVRASACRADFNGSGVLDNQDIFDFLTAWFGNAATADFDGSGVVNAGDIWAFLAAWFQGC